MDKEFMNEMKTNDGIDQSLFQEALYSHEDAERIAYSNYSYWKSTLRTFMKNKTAVALLIVIVVLAAFACLQPFLPGQFSTDKTPYLSDSTKWSNPPSSTHWFGTDGIGKDMWALVWYGTRISLSLAIIVAFTQTLIGVAIGALWGYIRRIDRFMTEVYNVIANVPNLVLYTLIAYIMKPGYWTIVFVMVSTSWIYMARYVRNMVLIIRDREYNLASRSLGTPVHRMLVRNILPHLVSVIIMQLALEIPATISLEVILTYLGVGLPGTVPSLGVLINIGQGVFMAYPHMLIFPALIVSIITVAFYVVGNTFSDASDPRNHT